MDKIISAAIKEILVQFFQDSEQEKIKREDRNLTKICDELVVLFMKGLKLGCSFENNILSCLKIDGGDKELLDRIRDWICDKEICMVFQKLIQLFQTKEGKKVLEDCYHIDQALLSRQDLLIYLNGLLLQLATVEFEEGQVVNKIAPVKENVVVRRRKKRKKRLIVFEGEEEKVVTKVKRVPRRKRRSSNMSNGSDISIDQKSSVEEDTSGRGIREKNIFENPLTNKEEISIQNSSQITTHDSSTHSAEQESIICSSSTNTSKESLMNDPPKPRIEILNVPASVSGLEISEDEITATNSVDENSVHSNPETNDDEIEKNDPPIMNEESYEKINQAQKDVDETNFVLNGSNSNSGNDDEEESHEEIGEQFENLDENPIQEKDDRPNHQDISLNHKMNTEEDGPTMENIQSSPNEGSSFLSEIIEDSKDEDVNKQNFISNSQTDPIDELKFLQRNEEKVVQTFKDQPKDHAGILDQQDISFETIISHPDEPEKFIQPEIHESSIIDDSKSNLNSPEQNIELNDGSEKVQSETKSDEYLDMVNKESFSDDGMNKESFSDDGKTLKFEQEANNVHKSGNFQNEDPMKSSKDIVENISHNFESSKMAPILDDDATEEESTFVENSNVDLVENDSPNESFDNQSDVLTKVVTETLHETHELQNSEGSPTVLENILDENTESSVKEDESNLLNDTEEEMKEDKHVETNVRNQESNSQQSQTCDEREVVETTEIPNLRESVKTIDEKPNFLESVETNDEPNSLELKSGSVFNVADETISDENVEIKGMAEGITSYHCQVLDDKISEEGSDLPSDRLSLNEGIEDSETIETKQELSEINPIEKLISNENSETDETPNLSTSDTIETDKELNLCENGTSNEINSENIEVNVLKEEINESNDRILDDRISEGTTLTLEETDKNITSNDKTQDLSHFHDVPAMNPRISEYSSANGSETNEEPRTEPYSVLTEDEENIERKIEVEDTVSEEVTKEETMEILPEASNNEQEETTNESFDQHIDNEATHKSDHKKTFILLDNQLVEMEKDSIFSETLQQGTFFSQNQAISKTPLRKRKKFIHTPFSLHPMQYITTDSAEILIRTENYLLRKWYMENKSIRSNLFISDDIDDLDLPQGYDDHPAFLNVIHLTAKINDSKRSLINDEQLLRRSLKGSHPEMLNDADLPPSFNDSFIGHVHHYTTDNVPHSVVSRDRKLELLLSSSIGNSFLSSEDASSIGTFNEDFMDNQNDESESEGESPRVSVVEDFVVIEGIKHPSSSHLKLDLKAPSKLSTKDQLAKQNQSCWKCQKQLRKEYGIFQKYRYCNYTHAFYCKNCHGNEKFYIPSRIVQQWDFSLFPVCKDAFTYLHEIYSTPCILLSAYNPNLFETVTNLKNARKIRQRLTIQWDIIQKCTRSKRLLETANVENLVFVEHTEIFSLENLKDLQTQDFNSPFLQKLAKTFQTFHSHISRDCSLCRSRGGHRCSHCQFNSDDIIYEYEITTTRKCPQCQKFFHRECFFICNDENEKLTACPLCTKEVP